MSSAAGVKARAGDDGILLEAREAVSYDVVFDGEPVWSFSTSGPDLRGEPVLVEWPPAMRPWLEGRARITLRPSAQHDLPAEEVTGEIDLGEVRFGSGEGAIAFVDKRGLPVVIDKWGIVQRPFSTRGDAVTAEMAHRTQEVIDILREECGHEAWMAFGTLLGAAREGKAIGHDSDVDLLYLSQHSSPAKINLECYRIKRALTRRGLNAVLKSGSFVTVLFEASDGAPVGIDVYACFYLDGLLHETATVRAPVPPTAILPLRTLAFEGYDLPAPADPATLLEASYGPGWAVPDPSFRHQPGPPIINRFDGWFGSVMTNRRAWEMWWHHHQDLDVVSALARRLEGDLPRAASVLEIGAGNGADSLLLGRQGHQVLALDYARHSFRTAAQRARAEDLRVSFATANLYDLRDVLTLAALRRRRPRIPRWLLARGVLDAIAPRGVDPLHRFASLLMRGGGRLYLEVEVAEGNPAGRYGAFAGGPPRYGVDLDDVRRRLEVRGARVLLSEMVGETEADDDGPRRTRWHVVAEWS